MTNLTDPRFNDVTAAREWLEKQRWPNGPVCAHCGNADQGKIKALQGKAHRPGLYQCAECREQFTVTVGSVMERSKIPLHKWVLAMHLMTASKKGVSAHQLHRMLGITYQSAWFLAHRIREAMRDDTPVEPMGGKGKTVEADETYIGRLQGPTKHFDGDSRRRIGYGPNYKNTVFALVERGGKARTFHIEGASVATLTPILRANVANETAFMTDEASWYTHLGKALPVEHSAVNHGRKEYVRGMISTNTVESYFSVFKRGMRGVYQHCAEKHLHRYLSEFEFRYNTRSALGVEDFERAAKLAKGAEGKRLTHRRPYRARPVEAFAPPPF